MTEEQWQHIVRTGSGGELTDKWHVIYDILFPGARRTNPFYHYECPVSEWLADFSWHFSQRDTLANEAVQFVNQPSYISGDVNEVYNRFVGVLSQIPAYAEDHIQNAQSAPQPLPVRREPPGPLSIFQRPNLLNLAPSGAADSPHQPLPSEAEQFAPVGTLGRQNVATMQVPHLQGDAVLVNPPLTSQPPNLVAIQAVGATAIPMPVTSIQQPGLRQAIMEMIENFIITQPQQDNQPPG
jgi:hypothetical protein